MDRAARRRQEKEDQRLAGRGIDVSRRDAAQVIALMRLLRGKLGEAREAGRVAPFIRFLHDNFTQANRRAPHGETECHKGCAHCCHVWVSVRAPEVLFAAAALPDDARAAIAAADAATAALDVDERRGLAAPCPLLDHDLCRIYAARPLACRAAASAESAACERAYRLLLDAGVPMPDAFRNQKTSYTVALAGALRHAGYAHVSYEFNGALKAALARPDAEAAWLAGEDVFGGVQRDPDSDLFVNPSHQRLYELAFG